MDGFTWGRLRIIAALILIVALVGVGLVIIFRSVNYSLLYRFKCGTGTICFEDETFEVNGFKFRVDNKKVYEFIKKYKTSGLVSDVWLWKKTGISSPPYELQKTKNLPTKVVPLTDSEGKIIKGSYTKDEEIIKEISVLGDSDGKNNFLYVYFDPRTIRTITPKDMNHEFADILYWTINGAGAAASFTEELLIIQ